MTQLLEGLGSRAQVQLASWLQATLCTCPLLQLRLSWEGVEGPQCLSVMGGGLEVAVGLLGKSCFPVHRRLDSGLAGNMAEMTPSARRLPNRPRPDQRT